MKKFLSLFLLIVISYAVRAQSQLNSAIVAADKDAGSLVLKESEFDFGKIPQGKPVYHNFEITNQGAVPLKLDNVQPSCGCTTPEWSKDPIPAGGSSIIKIGYNAANEGNFEKYITITYNSGKSQQIKIKGFVWKAPVGSAPANASVEFLKQQFQ